MLFKVGAAMMLASLVLATGIAALVLRSEDTETTTVSAEPRSAVVEKTAAEREFAPGQRLEIDDEPAEKPAPETRPAPSETAPALPSVPPPAPPSAPASAPVPDWPEPTADQVASASAPRYYESSSDADMTLTIEALGLYDEPVINSANLEVLDRGLMHEPETSLPWDGGAQRNVFIAGHYLGYPGTASHLVFYNLDKLHRGDEVTLKDARDRVYRYRVSEVFEAALEDSWVMGQVVDRDMLTLQTCIPPTFEDRLIVRADRA
jgi:sortase A